MGFFKSAMLSAQGRAYLYMSAVIFKWETNSHIKLYLKSLNKIYVCKIHVISFIYDFIWSNIMKIRKPLIMCRLPVGSSSSKICRMLFSSRKTKNRSFLKIEIPKTVTTYNTKIHLFATRNSPKKPQ